MRFGLVLVVVAAALFLLDRVMLAMEARGWVYWRKRRASPATVGGALLEIQQLVEPARRHEVEGRRADIEVGVESGESPRAAGEPFLRGGRSSR